VFQGPGKGSAVLPVSEPGDHPCKGRETLTMPELVGWVSQTWVVAVTLRKLQLFSGLGDT
jgi:hypothetical protein